MGGLAMPVNRCAAMIAPPIQAGQANVRIVTAAQNHGQKPYGLRSLVAAKKERPVTVLYLMHS